MMMRFIIRFGSFTLMTFLFFYGSVSAEMKASFWVSPVPVQTHQVLLSESAKTVRSKIECVIWCRTHWDCVKIAYDVSSKMCYLHPELDTSGSGTPDDVLVYSDSDPVCKLEDAPILNGADVATWHRNLTSLEGNVTCTTDCMQVGDDTPTVRCLASGQWETNNNCKQRAWRNNSISRNGPLFLPDTPSAGWSACFLGTPSKETHFAINFWDSNGNIVLHVNPRLAINGNPKLITVLSSKQQSGGYKDLKHLNDPNPTFPFANGQQFNLTVTTTGPRTLKLYVDGYFYADVTVRADINTITNIDIREDVRMSFVDLWCG